MSSGPDLFVVCKKLRVRGVPVHHRVPVLRHRLRKRAPKLEQGRRPEAPRAAPSAPSLQPPAAGRDPRHPRRRPAVRDAALVARLGRRHAVFGRARVSSTATTLGADRHARRRLVAARHARCSSTTTTGYELVALAAIFLFGWLLERRHGAWAPLLVFFARRRRPASVAVARARPARLALGGNGAALALLAPGRCATCWRRRARRGGRRRPARRRSRSRSLLVAAAGRHVERRTRSPGSPAASSGSCSGCRSRACAQR